MPGTGHAFAAQNAHPPSVVKLPKVPDAARDCHMRRHGAGLDRMI
jgi:hypothetical protein